MDTITNITTQNIKQQERYLIVLVKNFKIAFSATLVREILLFQRSQILQLPFYNRSLIGVVHHQNQIIPLVSAQSIFLEENKFSQTTFTVVRLGQLGQQLTGVGVVVDRMVESISQQEITKEHLFQITDIPNKIWQPMY